MTENDGLGEIQLSEFLLVVLAIMGTVVGGIALVGWGAHELGSQPIAPAGVPPPANCSQNAPNVLNCTVVYNGSGVHALVNGASQAQLSSTANQRFYRIQTFWQNSSSIYNTGSTKATFLDNFSSYASSSSVQGATQSFTVTAQAGFYAQVNVTQGATVIANGTAQFPFTLSINGTSGVAVTDKIPEEFNVQNALPSNGHTLVYTNSTQSVQFTYLSTLSWGQNSTSYFANYSIVSPTSYSLNGSQVFLPFPSTVNPSFSTVTLKQNGVSQTAFQVVPGGVDFSPSDLAAGRTEYLFVAFQPIPNLGGQAPTVVLPSYIVYNSSYNEANGSWVNTGTSSYYGQFILTAQFPYPFAYSTINLYVNGQLLPRTSFSSTGDTITILPQVVFAQVSSVSVFVVYFQFVGAPLTASITRGGAFLCSANSCATYGQTVIALAVISTVALLVTWVTGRSQPGKAEREGNYRYFWLALVVDAVLGALYLSWKP